jgi:uncharacterized protein with gpF-like domain
MCQLCRDPNRWLLKQQRDPQVEQVVQTTIQQFENVLQNWHDSILDALGTLGIDLASEGAVEVAVEQLLDPYRDRWAIVIKNAWKEGAEAGRSAAIQEFSLDISWDIVDPNTVDALEEHGEKAAEHTQSRMTGDLSEAISDAYQAGYGIDEIARLLRDDVFEDMQTWEARRVARTEGIAGANKGRLTGFKDAGASVKRWMARDDSDTRPSHNEADNQTVPLGESFTVGGESAAYPGDPTLSPGERINCRCLVLPEFDT